MDQHTVEQITLQAPMAWQLLLDWHWKQLAPARTGVESFDEVAENMARNHETILKNLIYHTVPRFLYDFFDEHGVKLFITEPRQGAWEYIIGGELFSISNKVESFASRAVAEEEGFYWAFKELNKRLLVK